MIRLPERNFLSDTPSGCRGYLRYPNFPSPRWTFCNYLHFVGAETYIFVLQKPTRGACKKQFSVSKTTGKITVKKGLKKKTYTVKVRVAAAGRTVFAATTRTVTIKIKVK